MVIHCPGCGHPGALPNGTRIGKFRCYQCGMVFQVGHPDPINIPTVVSDAIPTAQAVLPQGGRVAGPPPVPAAEITADPGGNLEPGFLTQGLRRRRPELGTVLLGVMTISALAWALSRGLAPIDATLLFRTPVRFGAAAPRRPVPPPQAVRHAVHEVGYALDIPPGWEAQEVSWLKHKVIVGPLRGGFAPNVTITGEDCPESLERSADMALQPIQLLMEVHLIDRGEIRTSSGVRCLFTRFENNTFSVRMRQTQYYIKHKNSIYCITCSSLASDGALLDAEFERIVRSFRIED